jgi:hypothetical protein
VFHVLGSESDDVDFKDSFPGKKKTPFKVAESALCLKKSTKNSKAWVHVTA